MGSINNEVCRYNKDANDDNFIAINKNSKLVILEKIKDMIIPVINPATKKNRRLKKYLYNRLLFFI
jgi:hypothetical protein